MRTALLLLTLGCAAPPAAPTAMSIPEVAAVLGQPNTHVYDANTAEMYARKHLPGATWVKFNELDPAVLPADREAQLIFYCALEQCTSSDDAARGALALGYRHVAVMPAGIFGWEAAHQPLEAASAASSGDSQ